MRLARWTPITLALLVTGCSSATKTAEAPTPTAPAATPPAAVAEVPKPAAEAPDAVPPVSKPEAAPTPAAPAAEPVKPQAAAPATPAPAPTSAGDPIVGRWEMKNGGASIVFVMGADKSVALDAEATRKGLSTAIEEQIQKDPKITPEQKAQTLQQMSQALDQQIKAFEGTWTRVGKLYKITNKTPGSEKAKPAWAKVDGDTLIATDEKGAAKKGDPVAKRMAG